VGEEGRSQTRLFTALSANFRRKPETVSKAVDAIVRGSPARQTLIDALASGGSPETQKALTQLLQTRTLDPSLRMSLVIGLSRTTKPTDASIRFLRELLDDDIVGTQALYGLGTFCQRLRENGDARRAREVGDIIVGRLDRARTQLRVLEWLRAVSNAGDEGAFAKVRSFEKDEREQVRAEAVRAVRRMPNADADQFIITRLNEDPSRAVKLSALDAARWRDPTEALVRSVTTSARGQIRPTSGLSQGANALSLRIRRLHRLNMAVSAGYAVLSMACVQKNEHPHVDTDGGGAFVRARLSSSPPFAQACPNICEKSRPLRCQHGAECEASCRAIASVSSCRAELEAFYACLSGEPTEHWECEDGVAVIRDGYCDTQQERFARCVERSEKG
jgi:hypothetical protein